MDERVSIIQFNVPTLTYCPYFTCYILFLFFNNFIVTAYLHSAMYRVKL